MKWIKFKTEREYDEYQWYEDEPFDYDYIQIGEEKWSAIPEFLHGWNLIPFSESEHTRKLISGKVLPRSIEDKLLVKMKSVVQQEIDKEIVKDLKFYEKTNSKDCE